MQRDAGFSLIEVMTVLVILCVLAALAYPSLQQHVIRSKRAQAQAALQQLMQQQERYYSQNNRYVEFSAESDAATGPVFKWWSGETATGSAYEMQAAACTGEALTQCVRLTAIPGTARVDGHFEDGDCGTLTLDSSGKHSASGAAARCWP